MLTLDEFEDEKKSHLSDGTSISAILTSEDIVLDDHVEGYFDHGITIQDGDTIFDVGGNRIQ